MVGGNGDAVRVEHDDFFQGWGLLADSENVEGSDRPDKDQHDEPGEDEDQDGKSGEGQDAG